MRNDGCDPAFAASGAIGPAIVAFVGDCGARCDVRAEIEQRLEVRRVGLLAAGQIEGDRAPVEIGLEMDFR